MYARHVWCMHRDVWCLMFHPSDIFVLADLDFFCFFHVFLFKNETSERSLMYYQFFIFLNNVANVHWFLEMRSDKGKRSRKNHARKFNTVNMMTFRCQYNQRITQNSGQIWKSFCVVEFGGISSLALICWSLASGKFVAANLTYLSDVWLMWRLGVCVAKWQDTFLSVSLWQVVAEGFCLWSSKASARLFQGEGKGKGNNFTGILLCAKYL